MQSFKIVKLLLLAQAVVLLSGCSRVKLVAGHPVHDSFETSSLSEIWETDKILPGEMKFQSQVVRSGHGALEITLHTSDNLEGGRNGNPPSERSELTEAEGLMSREGKSYSFSFSEYLPADFPVVKTRLIIAQWKQECPGGAKCDDNGPVLAVRYIAGVLMITQTTGPHRTILWQSDKEVRGGWLDFRFQVRFSTHSDGKIIARLNDSLIVDYTGATAYQENRETGYPMPGRFYFKMGLYRDSMADPMTIYVDEYTKELLPEK